MKCGKKSRTVILCSIVMYSLLCEIFCGRVRVQILQQLQIRKILKQHNYDYYEFSLLICEYEM